MVESSSDFLNAGSPVGPNAQFVDHLVYDKAGFDQKLSSQSCMLYSLSACLSEQLYERTDGKLKILPDQFYEHLMLQYDEKILDTMGLNIAGMQRDLGLSWLPFFDETVGIGRIQFEFFKY